MTAEQGQRVFMEGNTILLTLGKDHPQPGISTQLLQCICKVNKCLGDGREVFLSTTAASQATAQTAPSAQPGEQGMVRWELPSLADTQGSHTVTLSVTCTQACGDVLRIDTKPQLESDFPWSCSCSSLRHSTGCCQCRFFFFFFGNFEQGRKFSLNSSWASLSLCRSSKGSFYCVRQLDSSIHRHNLLKVLKLVVFSLLGT